MCIHVLPECERIHAYVCTCMHVYTNMLFVSVQVCTRERIFACMFACIYVCMCIRLYVCVSVNRSVCLSVCLSICINICMHVYMHVCMPVCLYVRTSRSCMLVRVYLYTQTHHYTRKSTVHCNKLQHTATHCNANAIHCDTLQHTSTPLAKALHTPTSWHSHVQPVRTCTCDTLMRAHTHTRTYTLAHTHTF